MTSFNFRVEFASSDTDFPAALEVSDEAPQMPKMPFFTQALDHQIVRTRKQGSPTDRRLGDLGSMTLLFPSTIPA